MIDPRRLEVLREVASRGSFSAAARALYLTQPAVSRHVAKLENEVGMRLFERTAHGLRLTDAGESLVARAEAISAQLVAANAELRALRELSSGSLRIAAFPSAAVSFVLDAMTPFKRRHPGVELTFEESGPSNTIRRLRAGELDLGVVFDRPDEAHDDVPGLERIHLLDDPMYVALPRDHPHADDAAVRLRVLAGDGWLTGTQPGGLIYRSCVEAGFEPRIVARSDDSQINQGLVAAGLAVTLVPGLARQRARSDIVLLPVKPRRIMRVVSALVLEGPRKAPAVVEMLDLLRKKAAKHVAR
jgi:molybdate transport repressor ModE-like protein